MTTDPNQPANLGDVNSEEPGSGARYNAGKAAFELVPLMAFEGCARVFDFGRKKYAPWNWAKGMPWSAPYGCLLRHLSAWQRGEDNDPESGLPHLDHAMANLVMLTTYARTYPQGDDRTQWLQAAETSEAGRFEQLKSKAQRAYGRTIARWRGAPHAADWLTEDIKGNCHWFRGTKPAARDGMWWATDTSHVVGPAADRKLGGFLCEARPKLREEVPAAPATQDAQDAERAAYLARWDDAPVWADWRVKDPDGRVAWFRGQQPTIGGGMACVQIEPRPVQGVGP